MSKKFCDEDFKVSSLCAKCSHCVAVAIKDDHVAVRNTRDPQKTTVLFTKEEWQIFVQGVKMGEFDF